MWTELKTRLAGELTRVIREKLGVEHAPVLEVPPRRDLGDLASPAAMQLARSLKRNFMYNCPSMSKSPGYAASPVTLPTASMRVTVCPTTVFPFSNVRFLQVAQQQRFVWCCWFLVFSS